MKTLTAAVILAAVLSGCSHSDDSEEPEVKAIPDCPITSLYQAKSLGFSTTNQMVEHNPEMLAEWVSSGLYPCND